MIRKSTVPILVVGGGAAGTMLSLQLARYGIHARTIDRLSEPAPTSRAITIHSRMLEIFECIDKELAQRFLDRGIKSPGYDLHYVNNGERKKVPMGIDFTTTDCRYPFLLLHRQDETEKNLREFWREKFGGETDWGKTLIHVEPGENGLVSTIRNNETNQEEIIISRYVIACDGINSQVRKSLQIEQDESNYQGTVLQNLDIRLNNFPEPTDHVHYCAGTDHFMMVARLPGDYYRLLVSDRGETANSDTTPEENIQRLMNLHFDGVSMGERIWHSQWESWVRLAKTYRQGNIFLVGDSAHVHSTTGGQGMNCCIQDAWNLGWKLGMVESGLAHRKLLDTYESERKPIAEQVIWAASSLHEIFMGHGKDINDRSLQMEEQEYMDKVVGCCSGISYTYADSEEEVLQNIAEEISLETHPGPRAGDRAPNVDLESGRTLYDILNDTRYTLLLVDSDDKTQLLAAVLTNEFGQAIKTVCIDDSEAFRARYELKTNSMIYLFRPDGYIGVRCLPEEKNVLKAYLAHYLIEDM